jgi:collagenase-like PrtC family protease
MPKYATFIQHHDQIEPLINAGATHLILEDSKIAIRSFSDDFTTPGFDKLISLSKIARKIKPDIEISINCDLIAHESHFPLLDQLIKTITPTIQHIRVQDPGLLCYFKTQLPTAQLHLNLETGNHTTKSLHTYAKYCHSQTVSNEVPYTDLQLIQKNCSFPLEILVFGPLLIQYSNRRFLDGASTVTQNNSHNRYIKLAQDEEFPGRYFKFYDNPHGHFMFAYFDRCLLKAIEDLKKLNMDYWLIDGRSEPLDYTTNALNAFKQRQPIPFKDFQSQYPRPLKLGFFRANRTDQVQLSKPHMRKDQLLYVGSIVDLIKSQTVTIECHQEIKVGDTLMVISPRHNDHSITINTLHTLQKESIEHSRGTLYIQIPWYKGARNGARLYKHTKI